MNILNKLKTTVLVTSIMLLPTVSYAGLNDDEGERTGLSTRPSVSSQQPTQEEIDRATEKALQNKAPAPIYPDL